MLKSIGIKKVYYSTGNSHEIVCEHVKNMISIQTSSSTRYIERLVKNNDNYNYNNLLKNSFPKNIKYINLIYFINYNFKNILPTYKIIITSNLIEIYDDNDNKLLESIII